MTNTIIVDTREPKHRQEYLTRAYPGVAYAHALPCGDVLLMGESESWRVEIKTANDLVSSLVTKQGGWSRLLDQLHRCVTSEPTIPTILCIIGPVAPVVDEPNACLVGEKKLYRKVSYAWVQATLLSVQQEWGVKVLWVPDEEALLATLHYLWNRSNQRVRSHLGT